MTRLLGLLIYPVLLAGAAFASFMVHRESRPGLTGMAAEYARRQDGVGAGYMAFFFAAAQLGYLIVVLPSARRILRTSPGRVALFALAASAGALAFSRLGMPAAELVSNIFPPGGSDLLFFLIPVAAPAAAVWASRPILGRAAPTIASPAG